jgi:hypothetical protein
MKRWANTGPNGEMQEHPLGEFVLLAPIREQLEGLVREWRDKPKLRQHLKGVQAQYYLDGEEDMAAQCADQLEALVGAVGEETK